jgi:hypothetical protein
MTAPRWTVFVRDAARRRVLQVDDYQSLAMTRHFNGVGEWQLEAHPASAAGLALVPGTGIVVLRDGEPWFSGPLRPHRRSWGDQGSRAVFAGPDDMVYLRDRLAYPVPTGPPYTAAEHDVRTGACSTVLRGYVDANAGPGANPERRVPGLTLAADPLVGGTVTGRARFDGLLDLLQGLAVAGGDLGFRVLQTEAGVLSFEVFAPVDRTVTAVLSPMLGTLRGFEFHVDPPETNYVIVAGQGEGTARAFVERGDSASVLEWGRVESFRDRRDTAVADELYQAADEELAEKAQRAALAATPIDTEQVRYGVDYDLGDRVTVVVTRERSTTVSSPRDLEPLVTMQDVVRAVRVRLTPDRVEEVEPVVGTPEAPDPTARGAVLRILSTNKQNASERIGRLERV